MSEIEELRAERRESQDNLAERLQPAVEDALAEGSVRDLVSRVMSAFRAERANQSSEFADIPTIGEVGLALREATERIIENSESDTDPEVVALALAVLVSNAAVTAYAADEGFDLTWTTMQDDDVRESHRFTHGQRRTPGDKFDVQGVAMSYPGEPVEQLDRWINCRCFLRPVSRDSESRSDDPILFTEAGVWQSEMRSEQGDRDMDETNETREVSIPWHGVLAPEGIPSGDGRMFAEESLGFRALPLPLTWQKASAEGHGGSVTVAKIERIWREDGELRGEGTFLVNKEADEVVGLLSEFGRYGVSVDATSAEGGYDEEAGLVTYSSAEIASASIVSIPAFAEAWVALGTWADEDAEQTEAPEPTEGEEEPEFATEFAPGTEDGPGWLTHPVDTDRLRDYWVRGAGAAKIAWGTPGDWARCRALLAKYIKPQYLSGYCANRHFDALGFWPGRHSMASALVSAGSLLAAARPALERSGVERVSTGKVVSVSTGGARSVTSPDVLRPGDRLQVFGVNAGPISAQVVKVEPFGDGTILTLEGEDVRAGTVPSTVAVAVPSAGPDVTSVRSDLPEVVELGLGAEFCLSCGEDSSVMSLAHSSPEATGAAVTKGGRGADGIVHTAQSTPHLPSGLTASASRKVHDSTWFAQPDLDRPTPITISDSGRVFGHIAAWGTCHIGFDGECITPPKSATNYAYFQTGTVLTEVGEVLTGPLTVGGGHAAAGLSWRPAVDHYDSTSTVFADVACGEDEHGIWIAGALRDGVDPESVDAVRASGALSGDWRRIGGNLELVAALAVNVPGFPLPRASFAASEGSQVSLTAAGLVVRQAAEDLVASGESVVDLSELASMLVQEMAKVEDRKNRMAALRAEFSNEEN